jgi:HAE1 family hydrophobic/amphiphilic exporter-1
MNLIRLAIERPIAVIAVVLMVVMFGMVALQTIPIQLSPDVNRPVITVTTAWPGAAPAEVENRFRNRLSGEMQKATRAAAQEGLESRSIPPAEGQQA